MPRRVVLHPVLGRLPPARHVTIYVDGVPITGRAGEPIAAALLAAGKRVFRRSARLDAPRSVFCAIGRCTDCAMTVDGRPNIRTCVTPVRDGMQIETQRGLGQWPAADDRTAFELTAAASELSGDRVERVEVAVVGAGPAGLCAAIEAAGAGTRVVLLDENDRPGGQLVKQVHRFFGSRGHYAGERGYEIGRKLLKQAEQAGAEVRLSTVVWGAFEGPVLGCATSEGRSYFLRAERLVLAVGASEAAIAFPGWTLPGVMGAGAAQTLINVHRVLPGERALVVGSGNVGLIVAFQLLQAGAKVAAVVESQPVVGGYQVHADRLRRAGVPILVRHSIIEAKGYDQVTGAVIAQLDEAGQPVKASERLLRVDLIVLAVGLRPRTQLAEMLNLRMYHDSRGLRVPYRDAAMRSSDPHVYVAGDLSEVSEATIAMEEGRLAGRAAAASLGYVDQGETERILAVAHERIRVLRTRGPAAKSVPAPGPLVLKAGKNVPLVECYQKIACNPCEGVCPNQAIQVGPDPTALPVVDVSRCTGCLRCVRICPGMAIFVLRPGPVAGQVTIALPWEFVPIPLPGQQGKGLDRTGRSVCSARVIRVVPSRRQGDTAVVEVVVPSHFVNRVRGFRPHG